jgi:hypothetical protein
MISNFTDINANKNDFLKNVLNFFQIEMFLDESLENVKSKYKLLQQKINCNLF